MKYLLSILTLFSYLGAHVLMFFTWRYFLLITDPYLQIAIAFILLMAIILSIIAPLLIYWKDNIFSRSLYLVIGLWVGLLANSILLAIVYYLFIIIFPSLELNFYLRSLYITILPILLLIPEAWSARVWKIKRIKVAIKDLPDYWVDKKIIHLSDIHLGPIWRQSFFDKLLKRLDELKPEAIFITGDLFDGMEANFTWFSQRKINTPSGVYYSFGNHDVQLGKNRVKLLLKNSGIRVLDDELHEEKGVQIIGLSFYTEKCNNLSEKIRREVKYSPSKPSILLYHEPKDVKIIMETGIDLQLSGHTHAGQIWPFNLLIKLLYRGFVHGIYRNKDYTLSVSAGTGTWGPPLRLGSRSEIIVLQLIKK